MDEKLFRKGLYYAVREGFNADLTHDECFIDEKWDPIIRMVIEFVESSDFRDLPPMNIVEVHELARASRRRLNFKHKRRITMSQQKQVTQAMLATATPEFIEEVVKKGFAGVTADGGLVDRRDVVNLDSVPVQKNAKLGIPAPAEISPEAPAAPDSTQTPPVPQAPPAASQPAPGAAHVDNADKSKDPSASKNKGGSAQDSKKPLSRFRFEFEITDGAKKVVGRKYVQADAATEAEAIDLAVAKLEVPEGCTHRYTGNFSKKTVEA